MPALGQRAVPVEGLRVRSDQGRVILDGVVRSEADRAEAGARAAAIAGAGNVVNRLTIRP